MDVYVNRLLTPPDTTRVLLFIIQIIIIILQVGGTRPGLIRVKTSSFAARSEEKPRTLNRHGAIWLQKVQATELKRHKNYSVVGV